RPLVKIDDKFKPAAWHEILPKLKHDLASAVAADPAGVVAVLSPFLTVEEAYLYAKAFKVLSPAVRLVLGPVPVAGVDDTYPKDVHGNPSPAVKFTIRAEKCPNRRGVEEVLRHFERAVVPFAERGSAAAIYFAGGYPDASAVEAAVTGWVPPGLVVAQDLFASAVTATAKYVLPATSAFEKDGTFVNHSGLAQTFPRAVRPPQEARTELQLASDLLGRKGLAQPAAVRAEVAAAIPAFAGLAAAKPPRNGKKIGLATV
ncbi:MAG: molybdopterin-dependent oxidoreductase, partial [Fimbriiglobus sp.]